MIKPLSDEEIERFRALICDHEPPKDEIPCSICGGFYFYKCVKCGFIIDKSCH